MRHYLLVLALGLFFLHTSCTTETKEVAPDFAFAPDNDGLILPAGFSAIVVADSIGRGRHLVARDNGDLYVHLRNRGDGGQSIVALRDTSGDGKADVFASFADFPGTGIRIHKNHLYFSNTAKVMRLPLSSDLVPTGSIDTIVHLEGAEGGHVEKTFDFDDVGNLYVNVGSLSNACQEERRSKESPGLDPCVELETRAGIWKFSDSETEQIQTLADRYATGIRNAVAVKWNASANSLYALQHGRDDLHRFWPEKFAEEQNVELPAEEFFQVSEGDDFGWPYCFFNTEESKKLLNPEYGGDGTIADRCEDVKAPLVGFPAHWAPNDLMFYTGDQFPEKYRNGAFIAFHGSWNRLGASQAGYKVVFQPMENGKPSGDWEVFADGFTQADFLKAPGDAKYRPCGLTQGPDGSLYIVDSNQGRVWRLVYTA